ncbi:ABC transporter permease subunit [Actinomadura sp. NTSP31]|uniref:ABC transporter permease subunit n=1 Tax=Actinomadura sp. NTSP31 TaxID=1735447 RepID=UPI0035C1AEAF
MTAPTMTPGKPRARAHRAGFGALLRAEWTKFRTVRGWTVGMVIAVLVTAGIALLDHSSCGGVTAPGDAAAAGAGCSAPVGPDGEAVTDDFFFVHRPLDGDGGITVRLASLTAGPGPAGLRPWAKAGLIVKAGTRPGSAYAALIVTPGHGVRMQDDFTGDIKVSPGTVSAASPRWLRLSRSGDTLTGYQSADGTHWSAAGTVHLHGLPATVQAGMLAASPASAQSGSAQSLGGSGGGGARTLATARFDHIDLRGSWRGGAWTGANVGGGSGDGASPGAGFHQAAGTVTVTGSGDVAPYVPVVDGGGVAVERTLLGAFGGLVAVIVVATLFMTAEYRRGLIAVTFAAVPGRGRVLAAKAVVIGSVTFAAGLAGSVAAVLLGERLLRSNGAFVLPVGTLTEIRAVAGTAALLAVAAVLALAVGTIVRHGAAAVTAVVTAIVLPYFFASPLSVLPAGVSDWLLRVTPAAAFAVQQTTPRYRQVDAPYTPGNGYFPLPPWAGFAVLCGYTVLALVLAAVLLRRRDA